MRKAFPTLLAATALTFAFGVLPAAAGTAAGAEDAATATENPAPVQESWMAGPEKAPPSTAEDPSSAEAIDEADVVDDEASKDEATEDGATEEDGATNVITPDQMTQLQDDTWIDPDADIATAAPEALGVKEHKVEIFKPLGSGQPSPALDAK